MITRHTGNPQISVSILRRIRKNNRANQSVSDRIVALTLRKRKSDPITSRLVWIGSDGVTANFVQHNSNFVHLLIILTQ